MKFIGNTNFLEPFLVAVQRHYPLNKLTVLFEMRPLSMQPHKGPAQGVCYWDSDTKCYSIGICLRDTQRRSRDYYDILETLAHELAHLYVYDNHDANHWETTANIAKSFSSLLREIGVKDLYVPSPIKEK